MSNRLPKDLPAIIAMLRMAGFSDTDILEAILNAAVNGSNVISCRSSDYFE